MKEQWTKFIAEYVRTSDDIHAYRTAYPRTQSNEAARVSASRLLKNPTIKNEIATLRTALVAKADEQALNEIAAERKFIFLSIAEKRELLCKIARGRVKVFYQDRDGNKRWKTPDPAERIKAIELDNEITGEGWRPPEPGGGTTINGPVFNTVVRKTIFKTRETTGKGQTFQIQGNE